MRRIAVDLLPLSDIEGAGPRRLSTSSEPWFDLVTVEPLAGRWIKIVWRSGLLDPVARPVIRCQSDSGPFDILPGAAIFGANEWIGFIPKETKSINLSPVNYAGVFGFVVEGLWALSTSDLCKVVFSRAPRLGFLALGAWFIGRELDMFEIIKDGIAEVPLRTYADWRAKRLRRLDPTGIDGVLEPDAQANRLHFVVEIARGELPMLDPLVEDLKRQSASNWTLRVIAASGDHAAVRDQLRAAGSTIEVGCALTPSQLLRDFDDRDLVCRLLVGARIAPTAVAVLSAAAQRQPDTLLFYADSDRLGPDGVPRDPLFHPGFDPLLYRSSGGLSRNGFWRVGALRKADLLPQDGAELLINDNATAPAAAIGRVLLSFTVPAVKPPTVAFASSPALTNVTASIIIPTRDRLDLLRPCVDSILQATAGQFRVVVVDNGSAEVRTLAYLTEIAKDPRVIIVPMPGPFNFSRLCNAAAAVVASELLVFLNNDTTVVRADWLQQLAAYAMEATIGAVGAKLLYPDGSIQHSGVIAGKGGQAGHFGHRDRPGEPDYFHRRDVAHSLSAVTGACLAVEARKFHEIGGFDEINLPIDLNDIDLCFRLNERGYRTVYVPDAVLIHHESASRGYAADTESRYRRERTYFRLRWLHVTRADPHFSASLSLYAASPMLG